MLVVLSPSFTDERQEAIIFIHPLQIPTALSQSTEAERVFEG